MLIRKASKDDIAQLCQLALEYKKYIGSFCNNLGSREGEFLPILKKYYCDYFENKNAIIYVAQLDNTIVGCIQGKIGNTGNNIESKICIGGKIESFVVREDLRGLGVGKELYNQIKVWFIENNCENVEIEVLVNNPVKEIYKLWGFEPFTEKLKLKL